MAKGLDRLKKTIFAKSKVAFIKYAKSFLNELNTTTNKVKSIMKLYLANRAIRDNNTTFPHLRTGNLANNLINITTEKFNPTKVKEVDKSITYSVKVISTLDNGINDSSYASASVKSAKGFAYANYLNYYNPKYKGYYDRLQNVFRDKLKEEISK